MTLARFTVARPIATLMATLMVMVLGSIALSRLQTDLLPAIELPTLTIITEYEGAAPEVVERQVTQIIEEAVATVPGVEEISSHSYQGVSRVTVSFAWGSQIDAAAIDLQATLENERNELPDAIKGPRVSKFDVDSFPVMILGISGNLGAKALTTLVENQLRYRFSRLAGVAQVDIWGEASREIQVQLNLAQISALAIPLNDISHALRSANIDLPAGRIESGNIELGLRAPATLTSLEEIRNTVVARRDGELVTLRQIATVEDTIARQDRIVRVNGEAGLRLAIRKQPIANTVEVARTVLDEVAAINRDLPQVNLTVLSNQGSFIERSIENVSNSLLYGGALAIAILLLFLRNLGSTLVITLAIPISLIATFGLLYFAGMTLNLISLGGLALGVGLMVDSSVVVMENIFRRQREHQESPREAAVSGSSEVAAAVTAGTLTTLVIFLPILFVKGVSGVLFAELAYVIMFALACALLVALTLVPMFASRFLPAVTSSETSTLTAFGNRCSDGYLRLLQLALTYRAEAVILALFMLAATLIFTPWPGSEYLPPSDEGEVRRLGRGVLCQRFT
ncbi:MAG: efflux RND transporter permease subunit [Gammaproteobacteria bacterium]|nr:efflux RND transporter permease subunit [Gammaproteobacteria bacterium]